MDTLIGILLAGFLGAGSAGKELPASKAVLSAAVFLSQSLLGCSWEAGLKSDMKYTMLSAGIALEYNQ